MLEKPTILYVDAELTNLYIFNAHFRLKGYRIFMCTKTDEAICIIEGHQVHILIIDQPNPISTGIEYMKSVKCPYPPPVIISVTAHRDFSIIAESVKAGSIFSYHHKPWDFNSLEVSIENAFLEYKRKLT